jgi:predicted alpha-1,2-mannosidase
LSEIEVFPPPEAGGDFVSQVDPFIETTKGRYFFFITGNQPFGMIGAAPLTRNRNQYGGGYNYNSTEVLGFPQIHNWVIAGLTLMPTTGQVDPTRGEQHWKSAFMHEDEIAQPGYHRLFLKDYGIWVEQTATNRTGFYRLTFTRNSEAAMLVNLGGYLASTTMRGARVKRVGDREIEGSFDTYGRHWGGPENVKIYFVVRFDRPFERLDGWADTCRYRSIDTLAGSSEISRRHAREELSYLDSPTSGVSAHWNVRTGERIHVRTAISYVSTENARENLENDASSWDFDEVRSASRGEWNRWLGKIEVSGGTQRQRTKFYTDLWHVLLGRHKIDDVNGQYPDLTDGERYRNFTINIRPKIGTLPRDAQGRVLHHMYNSDAFWLTQWNLNILWGLGWPEMLDEMSASLVRYADNGGLLPRGPCAGGYTYIMSGCPATPLIVSAYNKGLLSKCDPMHAFRTMERNHMPGGMLGIGEFYLKNGYQPDRAGMTVESNFQDWALSQMALKLGLEREAGYFLGRSTGWRKLYDPEQQLLFPKNDRGEWSHRDPLAGTGWIESNSWQATWGVSHDLAGLAALMGGGDSLCTQLDYAFEKAAPEDFVFGYGKGYVSYANQPGCSNAHVFSWGGQPWLTQYWVRRVAEQAYGATTPDRGYGGHDEAQGQMGGVSALMSIGLFSTRGTAAARPVYEITSPVFDEVAIRLDKNYYAADRSDSFIIRTYDNSAENCYIRRARLNGRELKTFWFPHDEFARGGVLELWMGPEPDKRWGRAGLPE